MMYSKRQNKVSRLLQKELAAIFQKEYSGRAFITVTVVRISPDLSYAKVYLSIMEVAGKEDSPSPALPKRRENQRAKSPQYQIKKSLDKIKTQTKEIRKQLAARIKNQLRKLPDLEFFIDDSLDYEEKIDQLINE